MAAYGRRWHEVIRPAILRRDGYLCQMRGPGCTTTATTVDHIIPVIEGGTNHPANLRAACRRCNYSAGASMGNRRRNPTSEDW